jgi:hypothetical protein
MHVLLHDIETIIEREIKAGATRDAIAMTLSFNLNKNLLLDWKRINRAILKRWKVSGKEYIMKKAFNIAGENYKNERRNRRIVFKND